MSQFNRVGAIGVGDQANDAPVAKFRFEFDTAKSTIAIGRHDDLTVGRLEAGKGRRAPGSHDEPIEGAELRH